MKSAEVFSALLRMSINAAPVILAVFMLRFFMKNTPRPLVSFLWLAVAVRLVLPFGFSPLQIFGAPKTAIGTAIKNAGETAKDILTVSNGTPPITAPQTAAAELPSGVSLYMCLPLVWLAGVFILLFFTVFAYLRTYILVRDAVRCEGCGNIFESDRITTPFVFGIRRPRIYLPFRTEPAHRKMILLHEKAHIKNGDHLIKPLAFALLVLHWFNPLVWLAFLFLVKDMEMSCDEAVLRNSSDDERRKYSICLLSYASRPRLTPAGTLAFGETNLKGRIKNIMKQKKIKKRRIVCSSAIILVSVIILSSCSVLSADIKSDTVMHAPLLPVIDMVMFEDMASHLEKPSREWSDFYYKFIPYDLEIMNLDYTEEELESIYDKYPTWGERPISVLSFDLIPREIYILQTRISGITYEYGQLTKWIKNAGYKLKGNIVYSENDKGVTVVAVLREPGSADSLTIPKKIGGKPVTELSRTVFAGWFDCPLIRIPEGCDAEEALKVLTGDEITIYDPEHKGTIEYYS